MTKTIETLAALPPLQRRMAETWLERFEQSWHDRKLKECMRALPPQSALRKPLLLAMIERDLVHNWQAERPVTLDDYLKEYPELGTADDLPIELIATEFDVRKEHGRADLADFAERYPSRIDDLYVLLKPTLDESKPPAPSGEDSMAAKRLKLLRASAEEAVAEPVPDQPIAMPRREAAETPVNMPIPAALPNLIRQVPPRPSVLSESAEIFRPPEPPSEMPSRRSGASSPDMLWKDVESVPDIASVRPLPGSKKNREGVQPPLATAVPAGMGLGTPVLPAGNLPERQLTDTQTVMARSRPGTTRKRRPNLLLWMLVAAAAGMGLAGALHVFNRMPRDNATPVVQQSNQVSEPQHVPLEKLRADLKNASADVRQASLSTIKEQKETGAVPDLIALVADDNWPTAGDGQDKIKALRVLEELSPESVERALKGAVGAKNTRVQIWACREIAQLGDRKMVSALVMALQSESGHVRKVAAETLRELRWSDEAAVKALVALVSRETWTPRPASGEDESDPKASGREAALDALVQLDPKRAEETLIQLRNNQNHPAQQWANRELGLRFGN